MSTNISKININMNNFNINVKENMIYESNFCKIQVERNTLKSYFWHLSEHLRFTDFIKILIVTFNFLVT